MENNRDFKGIWIPKQIRLSKELTLQEKIMYVEINSLDNDIWCFATNKYFADFFSLSDDRVSKIIQSLLKKGYISVEIDKVNWNKRTISTLSVETQIPISGNADSYNRYNNTYINSASEFNELFNENDKQSFKNELYIINKMFELWMEITVDLNKKTKDGVAQEYIKRVKDMMSRYIPRKEDWRLNWKKAKADTEDWFIYWSNPPKGKKKPTNFQLSLTNWVKPKVWK